MGFFDSVLKAVPIVGDVLSGIGSVFGAKSQKDANEDNYQAQKEFAQHGIQWKVDDARRAGLHPLYALGGSGAAYTPSAQAIDYGAMGQNLSRAASAASGEQRAVQNAQLNLLAAQTRKTEMETAVLASEEARARQGALVSNPIPSSIDYGTPGVSQTFPVPRAKPLEMGQDISPYGPPSKARFPEYIAGEARPAFREWLVPGVGRVLMPEAENFAEALESLENPINQAAVAAANAAHFGPQHYERFRRYIERTYGKRPFGVEILRR